MVATREYDVEWCYTDENCIRKVTVTASNQAEAEAKTRAVIEDQTTPIRILGLRYWPTTTD